ncbi:MAG TPA: 16S rRNA (guanine(966)-N(2))-methyltransferase RsmD [Arthrobacter sp.]|jgi:16S rRNA (guanine966-N2)-methyltransferase|nr:rsmD [Arthrobacter sp.]HET6269209.1 16S rRNA (guanine(966)-N(2))-methyltransferase RsmD [Arthrobacter sp.]
MSRVVAGAAGGTPLVSVPGSLTRPTTDRVKEALFSRLDAFDIVAGARVLDLYAGSGSLGVESASRGADSVDLVEFDAKASAVCQRNADMVNAVLGRKVVSVHRSKVESFLDRTVEGVLWDLVFLDPPYPLDEPALVAALAKLAPHLAVGSVVVVERSARTPEPAWPQGMVRFAEKKYGETRLWFAEPGPETEQEIAEALAEDELAGTEPSQSAQAGR